MTTPILRMEKKPDGTGRWRILPSRDPLNLAGMFGAGMLIGALSGGGVILFVTIGIVLALALHAAWAEARTPWQPGEPGPETYDELAARRGRRRP